MFQFFRGSTLCLFSFVFLFVFCLVIVLYKLVFFVCLTDFYQRLYYLFRIQLFYLVFSILFLKRSTRQFQEVSKFFDYVLTDYFVAFSIIGLLLQFQRIQNFFFQRLHKKCQNELLNIDCLLLQFRHCDGIAF